MGLVLAGAGYGGGGGATVAGFTTVGVGCGGGGGEGGLIVAADGAFGCCGGNAGFTAAFDGALGEMLLGPLPVPPVEPLSSDGWLALTPELIIFEWQHFSNGSVAVEPFASRQHAR